MSAGGIVLAIVMLVVLPVALFVVGGIWSALFGAVAVDDADQRATADSPSA